MVKKGLAKILSHFEQSTEPSSQLAAATGENTPPLEIVPSHSPLTALKKTEVEAFIGLQEGAAFVVFFPEYEELAPFLSPEGRDALMGDYLKTITNVLARFVHVVEIDSTGLASVAIGNQPNQRPKPSWKNSTSSTVICKNGPARSVELAFPL